jgi:hypothetical protein
MPERFSRITPEDLADLPADDGEGCGCDFGEEMRRPWPVSSGGGIWRPQGARALGAEAELEFV